MNVRFYRINSQHNSKVMDKIIHAIGYEKFTEDMIRSKLMHMFPKWSK